MSIADQNAAIIQKAASVAAYGTSGSLVLADSLSWLNNNAGAVGILIALLTFGINWYYQRKRSAEMLAETRRILGHPDQDSK